MIAETIVFPWMKQEGETELEHRLMLIFYDLGVGRDLEQLSVRTGKEVAFLRDIYARCRWDDRLAAYQKYLDTTVSALFTRQIAADSSESQKMIISMIRNKVGFLQNRMLVDLNDYGFNDVLEQIYRLCKVFDLLNKHNIAGDDKGGRNINIMFSPVIDAASSPMRGMVQEVDSMEEPNGEQEEEIQSQKTIEVREPNVKVQKATKEVEPESLFDL